MKHIFRFLWNLVILTTVTGALALVGVALVYVLMTAAKEYGLWLLPFVPIACVVVYGAACLTWQERSK